MKDIEEVLELSTHEKREIYKEITRYIASDEFKQIEQHGKEVSAELLKDIQAGLQLRTEAKATRSEVDKFGIYIECFNELAEEIGEHPRAKMVIESLSHDVATFMTHRDIKVEAAFDFPVYSEIDMIKIRRAQYENRSKYVASIAEKFNLKEEDTAVVPEHSQEVVEN